MEKINKINEVSNKQKRKDIIMGLITMVMVGAYTMVIMNVIDSSIFATIYNVFNILIVLLLCWVDILLLLALKKEKLDINNLFKRDKKEYKSPFKKIETLLLCFCFAYKVCGYSKVSWSFFVPVALRFIIGFTSIALLLAVMKKHKLSIWEIKLRMLPSGELFLKTYLALRDDLKMNIDVNSKEFEMYDYELAKHFYQEATGKIM